MRCGDCKYWHRAIIKNWPSPDVESKNGECEKTNTNIDYWHDIAYIEEILNNSEIGGINIYTNENFGCIHFDGGCIHNYIDSNRDNDCDYDT